MKIIKFKKLGYTKRDLSVQKIIVTFGISIFYIIKFKYKVYPMSTKILNIATI